MQPTSPVLFGWEPKKIQRYLEMTSNEKVAAWFGLSPTGTNEQVRSQETSTLNSTYDLCYGENYVVVFLYEECPWPYLYSSS